MKGLIPCSLALVLLIICSQSSAAAEEKTTGHDYREQEIESFIPCDADNAFWIQGENKVLQSLRDKLSKRDESHPASPQPLYVEVTGHFEDNPNTEGRTADYDGLYRIESVLASRPDSPAGCPLLVMDD
ncbi:hypothetical protein [Aeromonas sp. MR16]|uniref:hypothetical protein n=1 Tax=Aeromonas sp. MR16 TaxID=2923420 RepID=UPI001F4A471F|nr:hypothetical protein [Aeromonas sp. MR16]MCH7373213.1 hypothetical protein [Aeromonas sp. MR16]